MIKADNYNIIIDGSKALIQAELATLIFTLKNDVGFTDAEIKKCVEDGLDTTTVDNSVKELEKISKLLFLSC